MKMTVIASGSAGNCYVLEGRHSALILEAGVPPERMMANTTLKMSKVEGVLISHEHGDHAAYASRYMELGLPIFTSAGTLKQIGKQLKLTKPTVIKGKTLTPMIYTPVGEFLVAPFRVKHDAAEPFGFLILHPEMGKLLFLTDSAPISYNFSIEQVDHIMVEANYDDHVLNERVTRYHEVSEAQADRLRRSHLSIREACEFVRANETAKLKTVTLLHLSDRNADLEDFWDRMQETVLFADVRVARPGLVVELKRSDYD